MMAKKEATKKPKGKKVDWRSALFDVMADPGYARPRNEVNCAIFVNEAVKAMTGEDYLAKIGEEKNTQLQLAAFRRAGYKKIGDFMSEYADPVDPALAQVGDIAVMPGETGGPALGIVAGPFIKATAVDGTLVDVDLNLASEVYRLK